MLGFVDFQESVYPRWLEFEIKGKVYTSKCHEDTEGSRSTAVLFL